VRFAEDEREVLVAELTAVRDQAPSDGVRAMCERLLAGLAAEELPSELEDPLGGLLEAGLESGRIRRVHRADGETAALRAYSRLPRGRAVAESTRAVNGALEAVAGQVLRSVSVRSRGPGRYAVTVETETTQLTIWVDRAGAEVHTMEVSG